MDMPFFCIRIIIVRSYIPTLAVLLIGFISCKEETDQTFSFKPTPGLKYNYFVLITDSSEMPGFTTRKRQVTRFTLQRVGQKDSLFTMNMVIDYLGITQPGI